MVVLAGKYMTFWHTVKKKVTLRNDKSVQQYARQRLLCQIILDLSDMWVAQHKIKIES